MSGAQWKFSGSSGCSGLVAGDRSGVAGELVGLVDDVGGDLLELVTVLTGVVGAEQELTT